MWQIHRNEFQVKDNDIFSAEIIGTAKIPAEEIAIGKPISNQNLLQGLLRGFMDRKQIQLRPITFIKEQFVPNFLNHNIPRVNLLRVVPHEEKEVAAGFEWKLEMLRLVVAAANEALVVAVKQPLTIWIY
ncbi:hypothetical protein ACFX2G_043297 [Malus domestica]